MLTLADSFRAGAFTIFRDVVYRDGRRVWTDAFYALPDAPRLARDAAGGPAFDFLWYRSLGDAPQGLRTGGLVTIAADLSVAADDQAALRAAIGQHLGQRAPETFDLLALPFKQGSVTLTFAGEAEGGDLAHVAGSGPARLTGSQRATFVVDLTPDGAALLWEALGEQQDLFHLQYDLVCDVRLDDVRLRVWCDAERAHAIARRVTAGTLLQPDQLRETLVTAQAAGIELTFAQALSPDHVRELERLGHSVLAQALASSLFAFERSAEGRPQEGLAGGDGQVGRLRPYSAGLAARLNFTLSEAYPVERHFVLGDVLRLGLGRDELGERVRQVTIDRGFFRTLEVTVLCAADLDESPVDKVRVLVEYDHRTPSGDRVQRTGEFLLQRGAEMATFRTDLAAPDLTSVRYEADVYVDGDPEPYRIAREGVEGTLIVLDLDELGVFRLDVELRDVPLDLVRSAVVDVEYPSRGLTWRAILSGEHPVRRWQAVVRETPGAYRYRIAWLTADDRRHEEEWREGRAGRLLLDAPASMRRRGSVLVMSGGSFDGVRQVLAHLSLPDGTSPVDLTFTEPGQSATWTPPVETPDAFPYRATTTVVYADGTRHATGPVDEDRPVFVVRDRLRFDVRVIARLLDLGGQWTMALLALEIQDAAGAPRERKTLVLRDREDTPAWSVRLPEEGRRRYRYQLTLIPADGPRVVTPWHEADDELLVLQPPARSAPQEV